MRRRLMHADIPLSPITSWVSHHYDYLFGYGIDQTQRRAVNCPATTDKIDYGFLLELLHSLNLQVHLTQLRTLNEAKDRRHSPWYC